MCFIKYVHLLTGMLVKQQIIQWRGAMTSRPSDAHQEKRGKKLLDERKMSRQQTSIRFGFGQLKEMFYVYLLWKLAF